MPNDELPAATDPTTAANKHENEQAQPTFAELGVPERLVEVLQQDGKSTAFPIQAETLPDSLHGRDILGRGETGSGKTLAYSIPLIAGISGRARPNHPLGLVLAPTRELANQINDVLTPMARACHLTTTTIYGGVRQSKQTNDLRRGVDIVVACPGRLEDLIKQHRVNLDDVSITVLDEADEMADMGFLPAVNRIMEMTPEDGQRLLFSATLDHGVDTIVRRFLNDPKIHEIDSATAHVSTMTQHVFQVSAASKPGIVELLASGIGKRILFTRTKHQAEHLAAKLTEDGIPAAQLHGNLSQAQRDRNLKAFSTGEVNVMVATDVAARGMDVSGIELVAQIDPPEDPKSFLHRSGRTARAGQTGDVVTLVLPNQRRSTSQMLRRAGIDGKVIRVDEDSRELNELVGEHAPLVEGWSLRGARRSNRSDRSDRYGRSDRSERSGRGGGRFSRTSRRDDARSSSENHYRSDGGRSRFGRAEHGYTTADGSQRRNSERQDSRRYETQRYDSPRYDSDSRDNDAESPRRNARRGYDHRASDHRSSGRGSGERGSYGRRSYSRGR